MKYLNTIHASDETYFEEINKVVQEEPSESQSPEILGMLASIGIEKGKPFNPDARMQKILDEAADVGSAAARVVLYRNRDAEARVYPDSGWEHPWIGGSHTFTRNGARLIDARCRFHMYATGITPAMVTPQVGKRHPVHRRNARLGGTAVRWRQELHGAPAAQRTRQSVLGLHGL